MTGLWAGHQAGRLATAGLHEESGGARLGLTYPEAATSRGPREHAEQVNRPGSPVLITVAIVDDHPLVRRGLESVLAEVPDIEVSLSAGSPEELTAGPAAGREPPDVVLLDLYLREDAPCLTLIGQLQAAMKVLVISASGRPADVMGAIRAGASGYLTKLAETAALVAAIRTVTGGGFALSSELADILQAELARPDAGQAKAPGREAGQRASLLSPREREALDLIARGFTHSQAASRMGVSKATVDTYVERIRAKLHVGNKAELTRAALRQPAADHQ
jgi:two-component system nitrate/nitrite response regulator NarL